MADDQSKEHDEIAEAFDEAVNMTPAALEKWLATDEAKAVGTGVGHDEGEKIVAIKRKKKGDLTEDDYKHMKKVAGYVHRHLAQGGPEKDVEDSPWRRSLMNWGHDPLKK
jgi:hypothetical protein